MKPWPANHPSCTSGTPNWPAVKAVRRWRDTELSMPITKPFGAVATGTGKGRWKEACSMVCRSHAVFGPMSRWVLNRLSAFLATSFLGLAFLAGLDLGGFTVVADAWGFLLHGILISISRTAPLVSA